MTLTIDMRRRRTTAVWALGPEDTLVRFASVGAMRGWEVRRAHAEGVTRGGFFLPLHVRALENMLMAKGAELPANRRPARLNRTWARAVMAAWPVTWNGPDSPRPTVLTTPWDSPDPFKRAVRATRFCPHCGRYTKDGGQA